MRAWRRRAYKAEFDGAVLARYLNGASTKAAATPSAVSSPVSDKGSRARAGPRAHPKGNADRSTARRPARCQALAVRLVVPKVRRMKTLHTAYRITDLAVSLDFYSALGYQ